jgi:hypothetical protein
MTSVKGIPQLRARIEALKPSPGLMRKLGLVAVAEQKALVPRRTGNLARSIGIGSVTATVAETVATANYAAFVELGTRAHIIEPRNKKALRFAPGGGATLARRPRRGASVVFAKRVRHPGTKARPFMVPGARRAVEKVGFRDAVVKAWNDAA